ncbi:hypothetical protein MAR_018777 [Mya arenaria]|uniref:Uncharacterized protein n=1 Tax=Mya arenaria TaxID=6604 RepID=A0ABY7EI47_MYAAR|nr:hypothetical protein MAR_018777 [Mya arenaria]
MKEYEQKILAIAILYIGFKPASGQKELMMSFVYPTGKVLGVVQILFKVFTDIFNLAYFAMSDMFTISDADRYNNILQMWVRCCVKVTKRLLPMFVSSLGYTCVDQFLSTEKVQILKMPSASQQKNRDILYPPFGTQTQIEEWDMSLLMLATTVGQQYEDKLYPRSGKPTEVNTWNMSLCSCLFSVLCPKPHTLDVRLAESLNVLREMRNTLCHSERLEMEQVVYEEHMSVLIEFISSGLTYIGDVAFETEIKEGMDDIEHGKMRSYVAIDHKHLQESYESDREISQRLDGLEKPDRLWGRSPKLTHHIKNILVQLRWEEVHAVQQLTLQLQNDQGEMTLSLFLRKLKDDPKNILYSSFVDVFTQLVEKNAPEIVNNSKVKTPIRLEGRHITGAKRECLMIQLNFDNAVWMWKFIKYYISGTLDSLLEPIQTLLRT